MLSVIVTVLMFLIMISLHEFGHFIAGKLLGFTVLEYAIGFGPALFKIRGKNTLYSFRLIPFGGFCQFDGEDEEKTDVPGAFNEQKCWKRFVVLVAGAAFNILLGFIIYVGFALNSGEVYTNKIDILVENTALYECDIQHGDEIIEINGHKINSYRDLQLYKNDITEGEKISLKIKRDGEKFSVETMPSVRHLKYTYTEEGIVCDETIDGVTESAILWYSEKNPYDADKIGMTNESKELLIGFSPMKEELTAFNLIPEAYNMTCFVVKLVYKSLIDLITGAVGIEMVSGPVGVVSEVSTAVEAESGKVLNVLNITALLTINLGVMNLLPLPALDGGRLLFVLIEAIRRKPVSRDKEGIIHGIGFALLFAFMLFILFQDIMKLIR